LAVGRKPTNLTVVGGAQKRAADLQRIKRRLRAGLSDAEAVVVTHDTLCTPEFHEAVSSFDCARLLIADEANPPEFSSTGSAFRRRRSDSTTKKARTPCWRSSVPWLSHSHSKRRSADASSNRILRASDLSHRARWTTGNLTDKLRQNAWRDRGKRRTIPRAIPLLCNENLGCRLATQDSLVRGWRVGSARRKSLQ
jgi:hypothetical protein